jgi:hypothetical protein
MLLECLKLSCQEAVEATKSAENVAIVARGAETGYLRRIKSNKNKW